MITQIDNMKMVIEQENQGLRLKTDTDNLLLQNQTYDETVRMVNTNYEIVKNYFQKKVDTYIDSIDLKQVCLRIALRHFYMYNLWRTMYKKERNRDLTFLHKDFDHPQTNDIIIQFFKDRYPNNYSNKCEAMLDMSPEEFKAYDKNRQDFQNMF